MPPLVVDAGPELAQAAAGEAFEWGIEMAQTFERSTAAPEAALEDYRRHDADIASSVRSAGVSPGPLSRW